MGLTETSYNIKCNYLLDENGNCLSVTKELVNTEGKSALVIMFSSAVKDTKITDNTSHLLWNNMLHLGYTKVTTWNLFPDYKNRTEELQKANLSVLKKLLKNKDSYTSVIVAWGSCKEYAKAVINEKKAVYRVLEGVKDKLFQIIDSEHRYSGNALHPLYCGNYFGFQWELKPHKIVDLKTEDKRIESTNKGTSTEHGFSKFKKQLQGNASTTDN